MPSKSITLTPELVAALRFLKSIQGRIKAITALIASNGQRKRA